jgi:hypothetical protein
MMRKNGWVILALWITLFSTGCLTNLSSESGSLRIGREEVKVMLGQPDVIILDVRLEGEWKKSEWKIKGAIHENPEDFKSWFNKYPKEKTLILYCS